MSVGVDAEIAGARVGGFAGRHQHLQKPAPRNRQVVLIAALDDVALFGDPPDRTGFHADADLNPHRRNVAVRRCRRARLLHALIEQVFKLRALALEARRVHVGDIVRNDFDVELLGHHARGGD